MLDTRFSALPGPIPGAGSRSISVAGSLAALGQGGAADCGAPAGVTGVFVNVVAVGAAGPGHLTVYPFGSPLPLASTINFSTGDTVANGVVAPICAPAASCASDLTIQMGRPPRPMLSSTSPATWLPAERRARDWRGARRKAWTIG